MFFLLLCINLTLYIATGITYYNGNTKMAIIYGVIALILTLLTINFYRNQRRKNKRKNKKNESSGDWGFSNCGDVECFDWDMKDGFDCIDIECGKMDCIEVDCKGVECGGFDCNP
jgi:hypothetical protein